MKKKITIIVMAALACAACVAFASCGGTALERAYDRIADYRYALLRGAGQGFTLEAIGGVRETPYAADGDAAPDKTEYTVFTLIPEATAESAELTVTLGGEEWTVTLAPHPFRTRLSAEIPVSPKGDEISALTVRVNGEEVGLTTAAEGAIAGDRAFDLATEALGEDATKRGEVYLRLTENTVTGEGTYWYAAFVDGSARASVLLDAVTGKVRAVGG